MRRTAIGWATAAVVGTSLLTLPSALADRSSAAARTSTSAAAATSTASTATRTVTSATADSTDRRRNDCRYPPSPTRLTLQPRQATYEEPTRVRFRGYLTKNSCRLEGERVVLVNRTTGRIVGADRTNRRGFYEIPVRVTRTSTFVARFAGDRHNSPATSNVSRIVIRDDDDD
jgi:hypothetical protein